MIPIERQNSIGITYKDYIDPSMINIKKTSYSNYLNAYVKALFYNSKRWITHLEKFHIKEEDKNKFTKLVSDKSFPARKKYFENKTGRLNPRIRRFIDKYRRFQTTEELYAEMG